MEKVMENHGIWRAQRSTNPVNRMWEMNDNNDAVEPTNNQLSTMAASLQQLLF